MAAVSQDQSRKSNDFNALTVYHGIPKAAFADAASASTIDLAGPLKHFFAGAA
ncbi:MAG: hypothetical protein AAF943_05235 [Pseudomonadota bacterium]